MKKQQLNKKVVSFTLPVELIELIKEIAGKEKKSGSSIVEELIKEGLRYRKQKDLERLSFDFEKFKEIKGILSLGGNALEDSEAIYE